MKKILLIGLTMFIVILTGDLEVHAAEPPFIRQAAMPDTFITPGADETFAAFEIGSFEKNRINRITINTQIDGVNRAVAPKLTLVDEQGTTVATGRVRRTNNGPVYIFRGPFVVEQDTLRYTLEGTAFDLAPDTTITTHARFNIARQPHQQVELQTVIVPQISQLHITSAASNVDTIAYGNQDDINVGEFILTAKGFEDIEVRSARLNIVSYHPDIDVADAIETIRIQDVESGHTVWGPLDIFPSANTGVIDAQLTFTEEVFISLDESRRYVVLADMHSHATGLDSGEELFVQFDVDGFEPRGVVSRTPAQVVADNVDGPRIVVRNGLPTITVNSQSTTVLTNGEQKFMDVRIVNQAPDINGGVHLKHLIFTIERSPNTVLGDEYRVQDASTNQTIDAFIKAFRASNPMQTRVWVTFEDPVYIAPAQSIDLHFIGTALNVTQGSYVITSIKSDTAVVTSSIVNPNNGYLLDLDHVLHVGNNHDDRGAVYNFVWGDDFGNWTNGRLIPGLPTESYTLSN